MKWDFLKWFLCWAGFILVLWVFHLLNLTWVLGGLFLGFLISMMIAGLVRDAKWSAVAGSEKKKRLKLVLTESAVGALFGAFIGAVFFEAFFGKCATICGGLIGALVATIYAHIFE